MDPETRKERMNQLMDKHPAFATSGWSKSAQRTEHSALFVVF